MKEIVLPPHLYDRIKASAGEHGGIGAQAMFDGPTGFSGAPFCVHGHAWGTCTRYKATEMAGAVLYTTFGAEPELEKYLTVLDNDRALLNAGTVPGQRIPFERWCELLSVKRGEEAPRDDLLIKRLERSVEMTQREPVNA